MANLFTSQTPSLTNVSEAQPVTIGITVYFTAAGTVDGGRFYAPTTIGSGTYELTLWQITADDSPAQSGTGTLLANASFGTLTPGAWNSVSFSSPVTITPNTVAYVIAVRTSEGRYAATGAFFNSAGLTNGSISSPQTGTDPVGIGVLDNGKFIESITLYPNKTFNGNVYFVDPTFTAASGSVSATVALTSSPTLTAAATRTQFGGAALSSSPTLTASATRIQPATAALTSSPTLTAAATRVQFSGAALTSSPTLTVSAGGIVTGTAALTSNPTLTAAATRVQLATAALSSGAVLTAAGTREQLSSAPLASSPTLSAAATRAAAAGAVLISSPTLTAAPLVGRFAGAVLLSSPTLTANAQLGPILPYATAVLTPGAAAGALLAPGVSSATLTPNAAAPATLIAGSA